MIKIYTQFEQGQAWLNEYRGLRPVYACVLGFTETGLIPGISAAGATESDRRYTCLADAEFLYRGVNSSPQYPLPPLIAGVSPAVITQAIISELKIPQFLLNAGLPLAPPVPTIDLGGSWAKCLTTGQALSLDTVEHLFQQGLIWGEKLIQTGDYLLIAECVVGGTTTALSVLMGLGIAAGGKVNSSHPSCNHQQKLEVVQQGLAALGGQLNHPFEIVAAVGDPMQIVVAGMAIAASRHGGVLLAGGTQMLAVWELAATLANTQPLAWEPQRVVIGTTRWVAEDISGDTVGLAKLLTPVPLLATQLNLGLSRYPQLQAYEQGFVKEGLGAGGVCIAASLSYNWPQKALLAQIEALVEQLFNQSQ